MMVALIRPIVLLLSIVIASLIIVYVYSSSRKRLLLKIGLVLLLTALFNWGAKLLVKNGSILGVICLFGVTTVMFMVLLKALRQIQGKQCPPHI